MNPALIQPLIVDCQTFDVRNALAMARLAMDAYSPTPTIYCGATDTAVMVSESDTDLIIAFPGTRNLADWIKDAECWRQPSYFGSERVEIHAGFYRAFLSVEDAVVKVASAASAATKRKWILGHSKGGALATICAGNLRGRDIPLQGVYTFGEPRNGNKAWADYCDAQFGAVHFRLVDQLDAITHLPGLFAGNRHSGQCEFMLSNGGIMENPVLIAKIISDAWEVWLAKRRGPAAILAMAQDHFINRYVSRLEALQ